MSVIVDFEFELNDMVNIKAFSKTGIVKYCAISKNGKTYLVNDGSDSQWWDEEDLDFVKPD